MTRISRIAPALALAFAMATPIWAQKPGEGRRKPLDEAGIARLVAETNGRAQVSLHKATGGATFVRLGTGQTQGPAAQARTAGPQASKRERSQEFLSRHGGIFGIRNMPTELEEVRVDADRAGGAHITYRQRYQGLPVFAGELKSHFDAADQLTAVSGTFVPEISVNSTPTRSADEASRIAVGKVESELDRTGLSARGSELLVFRAGLAQGVAGPNHLAWKVEVGDGDGMAVREFVFIDAHTGKFIDQITGIQDDLYRRAYNALGATAPGPSYPASPFWVEGQVPFPTGTVEADNMILASGETYGLFSSAFGRDSFDGAGATMDSIFNRGNGCPNASWNGTFISFCPGLTTDDVTGHEWAHAYTQYTHNLIYQWQPGALNESYSDIFGETVDRLNGRDNIGNSATDPLRTAGACSVNGGTPPPQLTITGGSAAGSYFSRASVNEPPRPFTVGPTAMAIAASALPFQPTGACGAVTGVSGKIAIVDWTLTPSGGNECGSGTRANNARLAGATGIIFVAPPAGVLNLGASALIASVQVTNADGATIKAGLPASATISLGVGTDNSTRWLLGEDDSAPGLAGPLRDMWNPRCFGNPGKVTDTFEYVCSTADGGGVHTNSGVPNHAYALLVDGGTYNGQTISAIGLTKAAHIYFRAMSVYQGPASDFADHADALDQSCSDLVGVNLADLSTGFPSGQIMSASDCAQVAKAALAVELRTPPTQCNFQPLLAKSPPPLCAAGGFATQLFHDNFENGNSSMARWSVSHSGITADFTPRDWQVVSGLPDNRPGSAFFGPDPDIGTCGPGGDETAVLHLVSPKITIPASVADARLTFDHWVATEPGWDGGNLKISVNGGPWTLVQAADFVYNPYNTTLFSAGQGNTNPIAGEPAFSGTDGGAVAGSWGRSIVNLAPYAKPKDKIHLRFDIGNDGCSGNVGWFIDDLMVYKCHN
jgi:Zn-dependent metalloprotease